MTRRDALKGAAAVSLMSSATALGSAANSAEPFGIIGTGGRGTRVSTYMAETGKAQVAAICDIYPDKIDQAKTKIPGADGAKVYRDYRDLLADDSIDTVLITTPVYLHAEHFEAAVEAGKHIYCEKPAAPDAERLRRIAAAGEKVDSSKVVQWGFQQRFSPEYLKAMDYVETGKLGDVELVLSYWIIGNRPLMQFESPYPKEEQKVRHWGLWMDRSGGPIVEQDCHGVDMLNWYLKARPEKAVGRGGLRYPMAYGDWTSDHHDIIYTYPDGKEGWLISIKFTAAYRAVYEQIYGSEGMIEVARTYFKLHGPSEKARLRNADSLEDRSLIEKVETKRDITIEAVEHFYDKIRAGEGYNMTDVAVESTGTSLMGRMAYEYEREVTWEEMWRS